MLVDDLRRTKETLLRDGWVKYVSHQRDGHCLHGAMADVCMGRADHMLSMTLMITAVRRHLPKSFDTIPNWNDQAATTFEDVIAVLDKAICDQTSISNLESTSISLTEKSIPQLQPS